MMNLSFSVRTMAAFSLVGSVLIGFYAPSAEAVVQEIRAEFAPDPANPMVNKFVNKTPETGVCPNHMPSRCESLGIFSLQIPGLSFDSNQPIEADHEDPRQGATFSVPSSWRDLEVAHTATDERATLQVRIAGIGGTWRLERPPGVSAWARPGAAWNSFWSNAPAPCSGTGLALAGVSFSFFFWLVPEGAGACSRTPSVDIPWFKYHSVEYAYELKTPNPLSMSTGEYKGSLTYTAGPGMDFDMGDLLIPNDNTITLNFTLDVKHLLKVEIPPGGNRVELVPQGGWQSWLQQGRKPTRLLKDQTFHISASSRFKMLLVCEFQGLQDCMIRDPVSQRTARVLLSVSLPNGLTDLTGQPVRRQPLLNNAHGQRFQPGFYVDRAPGILHFEIPANDVDYMLRPGVAATYAGDITVIWDSEV
jgi:hypothetical protein